MRVNYTFVLEKNPPELKTFASVFERLSDQEKGFFAKSLRKSRKMISSIRMNKFLKQMKISLDDFSEKNKQQKSVEAKPAENLLSKKIKKKAAISSPLIEQIKPIQVPQVPSLPQTVAQPILARQIPPLPVVQPQQASRGNLLNSLSANPPQNLAPMQMGYFPHSGLAMAPMFNPYAQFDPSGQLVNPAMFSYPQVNPQMRMQGLPNGNVGFGNYELSYGQGLQGSGFEGFVNPQMMAQQYYAYDLNAQQSGLNLQNKRENQFDQQGKRKTN